MSEERISKVVCGVIDWSRAPRRAKWWALDADGNAHWFLEPNVAAFTDFWFGEVVDAPTFDFQGDWRTSLAMRPVESSE
ncbi:hypothetical protein [Gellertiella hungarica]|uniref:Uncharacterized protein n=1 Tax=Gellertiella hungarica TaxID=1572859 RepID=A0A7W6J7M9_9HYPH|nr:hypothetical protein [Gellertiella hungarica]MBB4066237.1 hypothetical protein [Gellertiella hungarica]